jgi:hypothetical protein
MPLINLLPSIVKDTIPNPNPPANALQAAYNSLLNSWYDVTRQADAVVATANNQINTLAAQLKAAQDLLAILRIQAEETMKIPGLENAIRTLQAEIDRLNGELSKEPKPLLDKKNPLPNSIFNMQNVGNDALFWLVMAVVAKKDPKSAERIIIKMYDTAGTSLRAYCHAGMANKVSAWGAGQLLSLFMERHGFITQEQALNFQLGQTIIAGAGVIQEGAKIFRDLPVISYFVAPANHELPEFPSSVSLSDNKPGDTNAADSIIPAVAGKVAMLAAGI